MLSSTTLKITLPVVTLALAAAASADTVNYRVIVTTGETAPGAFGGFFTSFGVPHLNAAGEVAFSAATSGQLASTGMWRTRAATINDLYMIAGADLAVPGAPAGTRYGDFDFSFYHPLLNQIGNVGFSAPIYGHPDGDLALMREIDGTVSPNALPGDDAPGFGAGYTFADFGNLPAFSDNDLMVFEAQIAGPGINGDNDEAVYANWFGGLQRFAYESQPAPGLPGTTLGSFSGFPQINENGKIAFRSVLHGAHEGTSLWSGWPGLFEAAFPVKNRPC